MDTIKTLTYAGLGLAMQTNEKVKNQFNELVELGKKTDLEGKNIVGDFFKTIDTAKEDIESQIEKNKTKLYDTFPALKEMEEKFSSKAEEMKSTIKETINNAKGSFSRTEDSNVEEATIVEESEK
ncbi:MAG: hypothetical protein VX141_03470 [Bacteroidota bacterium]|nr:hypothetical protein [Bacteroidota bacterium]MEC7954928.1 hypothetical protein [Bacteroidota bacterium]MED6303125.1 hypothetical protein [Bacteroidota bacterium]|tara:strand:- start:1070 stop:1444 length:375 start_codon:yes stop_codon:yes gene_type:complete